MWTDSSAILIISASLRELHSFIPFKEAYSWLIRYRVLSHCASRGRAKLAKQHARLANIRKDTTHKLTASLTKHHALIAIEDLHVSGMLKNHKLAQAVSDSNFGEIRRQLTYKAEWQSVHLVTIDRFYPSSKTCSGCGYIKPKLGLSERTFICEECGLVLDRDVNAAMNLKVVAVSSIDTQNACGAASAGYLAAGSETSRVEAGTKGDVWAVSQMSMF